MKKLHSLMFIAAAAMAFTGCSKENTEDIADSKKVTITITAENDGSRTQIDDANKVSWSTANEALAVLETIDGASKFSGTTNYTLEQGKAQFSVAFTAHTGGAKYDYVAVYPQVAYVTSSNTDLTAIKINLPKIQKPTATSFDPQADLMVTRTVSFTAQATALNFAFGRVVALGKMSIKNLGIQSGESVKEVTFSAPNKTIAGRGKVNLTTGSVLDDQWGYASEYKFNEVVLQYADNAVNTAAFDAWFTCIPFSISAAETFKVEVLTTRGTYTKEVTLVAGKSLAFTQGALSSFGMDMASATFVETAIDLSIFNISFGQATAEMDYTSTYDMGNTGKTGATLTYSFQNPSKVIRTTAGNQLKEYEGASSGAYYWCTVSSSPLQIGNVAIDNAKHFTLSLGAGYGITQLQAYISVDNGAHFFPLSKNGITTTTDKSGADILKKMNFSLVDATEHANCIIKLVNEGPSTCVVDDMRLVALESAPEGTYPVDFLTLPELITTPNNGDALTFLANGGTAGSAPAAGQIQYMWEGGNCTFDVTKNAADTWYTISDNGNAANGLITVTATEYTSTTADRTGTVTLTVSKNSEVVKTSTITIKQTKVGGIALETYDETFVISSVSSSYSNGTTTSKAGTSWAYTSCRTDQKINGNNVLTFKAAAGPKLTATVSGKVQNITFDVGMPYGDVSVSVDLYINDTKVGSYTATDKTGTNYKEIDVSAQTSSSETTKIEFQNGNAKRAAIGNISYQK